MDDIQAVVPAASIKPPPAPRKKVRLFMFASPCVVVTGSFCAIGTYSSPARRSLTCINRDRGVFIRQDGFKALLSNPIISTTARALTEYDRFFL
ncbi:hypothetical protein [Paraburkholderia kururiensis]|uniref:hypothetical protein n=1 Tax=Paraburkholderia kururiensis TaxID=984307 RepID=UPI00146FCF37|nr:hypothetical protein [Paraburkholderia kururiensis]